MSKEKKYLYAEAYKIAVETLEQLKPHCLRIEIAGLNLMITSMIYF